MHTTRSPAAPASSAWMAPLHLLRSWLMPTRTPITHYAPPRSAPRIPHQLALPFSAHSPSRVKQVLDALPCPEPPHHLQPLRSASRSSLKESALHPMALGNAHIHSQIYSHIPDGRGPRARLKVVRHLDASLGPAYAGRMLISGRMDEVCAEVECLSQRVVRPLSS